MVSWAAGLAGQRTLMCYLAVTLMTFDKQSNGRRSAQWNRSCSHRISTRQTTDLDLWQVLRHCCRKPKFAAINIFRRWCGLRPSVLGQDRSETKQSVLVLQVWCRDVKHDLVALIVIIRLSWRTQQLFKYYLKFLYSVLGTSLLWRSTVAFTYLEVKSNKCLCLLPVVMVLVLLFWSWSRSCKQRSWSWS